ncbi:hypothetical protein AB4Z51_37365 [Bradyrhizobium sp. 2TAF36]|uniref:ATP-dependent DNA ligase n=1 Tax=unclassified Bradyrhizobium TaxID=2631580 RepID=UPI001FCEF868|nr:hypothetical protein [Bradyrhizobium sp. MOS001]
MPAGPGWIHEIKYDGYRARLVRDGEAVRLESKAGLDWTWRFPWIVQTARQLRQARFAIDGEIVVLDARGISDFNALHSGKHNAEASSTPSTCSSSSATICASCRYSSARPSSASCCAAGRKESSSRHSSQARSVRICSRLLARWASRARFQASGTALSTAHMRLNQDQESRASGYVAPV